MPIARILLPFAFGYLVSYCFRVINAAIAPHLARDLNLGPGDLGLLTGVYFLAFATFQLPLGLLLDRFGARRTEAVLLGFAVAGALLFALAESFAQLLVGRALIGLGVSACLMAAFKAFVVWFPRERLPLVNGCQMAAGGMGALAATAPVTAALTIMGWREIFLVLAVATALAALAVWRIVPERPQDGPPASARELLAGFGSIFTSRLFWRAAPLTVASQASFLAVQGLWSGPWLRDVAGFPPAEVGRHLLLIAAAMVAGFLGIGGLAERLGRLGIPAIAVAIGAMACFMLSQAMLAAGATPYLTAAWIAFGFFGTAGILPYAALSQRFPAALAGRLNTALNVLVFVAAFAQQWWIGALLERWPATTASAYAPAGYTAAFAIMLLLQAAALAWFFLAPRFDPPAGHPV